MLIVEKSPKSVTSEAFRTLRTNIQYSSFDKKVRTILVTSAGKGEGKSSTCANLALTIAETGKKVLLVDCDLRKPTINKKFGVSNKVGISNYLLGEVTFQESVEKYSENLYILTSGTIPPNPAEMLSSNRLKEFIEKAKEDFDCIVVDSPPVLAVTDAQILGTIVDGVLMVVSWGQTEKEMCIRAKELLSKVKANILGVVLTKVKVSKGKGYGYSYYYYYGDDGKKKKKNKLGRKGACIDDGGCSLSHNS